MLLDIFTSQGYIVPYCSMLDDGLNDCFQKTVLRTIAHIKGLSYLGDYNEIMSVKPH